MAKLNEDRNQVKLKICQKLKEVEKTIGQKLAEKDREIAEYKDKAETRKRNLVSILSNFFISGVWPDQTRQHRVRSELRYRLSDINKSINTKRVY